MIATVGRIVHFYDLECFRDHRGIEGPYPAMVTAVGDVDELTLLVFPVGYPPITIADVPYEGTTNSDYYWTWPPRE